MDIVSLCPFQASSFVWQAHTGAHALTVIVKATFLFRPGESVLAPEQEPVSETARAWDDDPRRSIRVPSDRVPYKPRAEVMLVGRAYAPHRQPVRSLVARMIIGEIDKSIEVWCDRGFRIHDGQLLEGPRFVEMPLGWERAAGGPDTSNPVGMRFDAAPDRYGMVALPNLQPAGTYVSRPSDTFVPVGFGPVSAAWPGRAQRLGRYGAGFRDPGWEQSPIRTDFDARYFQAAPPDQQVAEIRPNERIVLENLHPEHTRLVTTLPGIRPRAIADRATGEREEVQLVADTLWIDTDHGLCCVVWRGRIGLRHAAESGRIAVWVDGMPIVASAAEISSAPKLSQVEADVKRGASRTMFGLLEKKTPVLPFVAGMSKLAESDQEIAASLARWAELSGGGSDGSGTMLGPLSTPTKKVLPFAPQVDEPENLAETIPPIPMTPTAPTPFMPAVPPLQPLQFKGESTFVEPSIETPVPQTARPAVVDTPAPEPMRVDVVPPPMLGPLATAEMARDKLEKKAPAKKAPVAVEEHEAESLEAEDKVVELSIEETATIAAEIAEGRMERAKVLKAHALGERAWEKNEARWRTAMDEEQGCGKNRLQGAYDAAYVKRVEGFRGAVTVDEYARILVGIERASVEAVLDGLRIQLAALMPIVRVWAKKTGQDMKLGRAAMGALREARKA